MFKKDLTGPTLLEMGGYGVCRELMAFDLSNFTLDIFYSVESARLLSLHYRPCSRVILSACRKVI